MTESLAENTVDHDVASLEDAGNAVIPNTPIQTPSLERRVFAALGAGGAVATTLGAVAYAGRNHPTLRRIAGAVAVAGGLGAGYLGWREARKAEKSGDKLDAVVENLFAENPLPELDENTTKNLAGTAVVAAPGWVSSEAASVAGHALAGAAAALTLGRAVNSIIPTGPRLRIALNVLGVGAGAMMGGILGATNTKNRLEQDVNALSPAVEEKVTEKLMTNLQEQMPAGFMEQFLNQEAARGEAEGFIRR